MYGKLKNEKAAKAGESFSVTENLKEKRTKKKKIGFRAVSEEVGELVYANEFELI